MRSEKLFRLTLEVLSTFCTFSLKKLSTTVARISKIILFTIRVYGEKLSVVVELFVNQDIH
jgi:hypothetical protein